MANANFSQIEKKWQKKWEEAKIFKTENSSNKKKVYVLEMFPYPSGYGLHIGHAFNYTIGDIYARFKRMNDFNVLYPMGYDAFGLPAENAAIKAKEHPKTYTENAIKNFIQQQKMLGLSYDWSRLITTSSPDYYKWNQFFFLELLKKGLVYRKKAAANWCPKCSTVLANEQVHNGKCWRHEDTKVEIKQLEQWFIKTTAYADELLEYVPKLDWPDRIKLMQKNWIGKSYGTEIEFKINNQPWKIFTTRPDTIYGVTFMVVSSSHPRLNELTTKEQKKEVDKFLEKIKSTKEEDIALLEKEGAFTGSYAINPLTNKKIPVWVANFVIAEYGSGMVMADAHDQRDLEFAHKYKINLIETILPEDGKSSNPNKSKRAFTDYGVLVNSGEFSGLKSKEAIEKITNHLEKLNLGKQSIQFKLRDWLVSRQRYWGTPIPIIYCKKCGIVPEKNLPVKLPENVKFGIGNPLETNKEFTDVKCPKCNSNAKRETDTMDTFFDSSWYFFRFTDPNNKKEAFNKDIANYWLPVDMYIGGAEHACMHLIYARFFTKALRDLGYTKINEPFSSLFNQGMVHANDGNKMSKSLGNVINPNDMIEKYSADILRLYLVSTAQPDTDYAWSDTGIEGSSRFINKVVEYFNIVKIGKTSKKAESKINSSIKEITNNIESFKYNIAVIKLRELFESLENETSKQDLESFLKLLSVFSPHLAEELYEKLGNKSFISLAKWPIIDESKIDKKFEIQEKALETTISDINNVIKIIKEKENKEPTKIYLYIIPNEKDNYNEKELGKRLQKQVKVFLVNDKNKYDPQNKALKAKPNKPGIYLE